jgi:predicted ribosome quality control (RQC) complex YloA/Tae2 family protein
MNPSGESATNDNFLRKMAPGFARLSIWHGRFWPVQNRVRGATLQKVTASDEGYVSLSLYRPGDDRTAVVISLRRDDAGIILTKTRPQPQKQPNSFVQVARKYLMGRSIVNAYASMDPIGFYMEFSPSGGVESDSTKRGEAPGILLIDLESKPARVVIASSYDEVPQRYQASAGTWPPHTVFLESYCEWSLDTTKTKRRATFERAPVFYSCWSTVRAGQQETEPTQPPSEAAASTVPQSPEIELNADAPTRTDPTRHEFGFAERKAFEDKEMTFDKALAILPAHIRKAVKTRVQFLERRLLRQRADLPSEREIERLSCRAEGLRAHLYLWPENSQTWYVPHEVIEEFGLPAFLQLQHGQKPGDILEEFFKQSAKLRRRRNELQNRLDASKAEILSFQNQVIEAGTAIERAILNIAPEGRYSLAELGIYFSRIRPAAALDLCKNLHVSWQAGGSRRLNPSRPLVREPYRSYRASTGEFIRVARSAQDGDTMLKLMPGHHYWLHVLSGEGSHVWLEKPRKAEPSPAALREAQILAVHHSKLARGHQGEVRVARRADVEKKKDLAPGKVLVRRCTTVVARYEPQDVEAILRHTEQREDARAAECK